MHNTTNVNVSVVENEGGIALSAAAPSKSALVAALALAGIVAAPAPVTEKIVATDAPEAPTPAPFCSDEPNTDVTNEIAFNRGVAGARALVASLIKLRAAVESENPRRFQTGYSLDKLEHALDALNDVKTFKGEGELFEQDQVQSGQRDDSGYASGSLEPDRVSAVLAYHNAATK